MGYVHNTHITCNVPGAAMHAIGGSWSLPASGSALHAYPLVKAPAAETAILKMDIPLIQSTLPECGAQLQSLELHYQVANAELNSLAAQIVLANLPCSGSALAARMPAFTYDADHDSAAKRKALGDHAMKLTLEEPAWLEGTDLPFLETTIDAPDFSTFKVHGGRANFTLRL